jgi:UDP-N-acetylenolpyruvoylglucosamine reductase
VRLARKKVFERSGIKLELEVKLVGFEEEEIAEAVK